MFKVLKPICLELSNLTFRDTITEDAHLWNKLNQLATFLKDVDSGKYDKLERTNNDTLDSNDNKSNNNIGLLNSNSTKLDPKFAEYIFIPLTKLLQSKQLSNNTINYVLSIIYYLLKLSWCNNLTLDEHFAQQLFPIIDFLTGTNISLTTNSPTSNNTSINQDVAVDIINQFIISLHNQDYSHIFFQDNDRLLHHLTNIITKLLNYLSTNLETENKLDFDYQWKIIDSLQILYTDLLSFDNGETISYILPGNVSILTKALALKGFTLNYKIIAKIMKLFENLLKVTYNDLFLETTLIEKPQETENKNEILTKSKIPHINKKLPHRKDNWLLATREQIKLAINNFLPNLIKRSNLHNDIAKFIESILINCEKSLSNLLPIMVQNLILIQQNPNFILTTNRNLIQLIQIEFNNYVNDLNNFVQWNKINNLKELNFICDLVKPNNLQTLKLINNLMLAIHEKQTNSINKKIFNNSTADSDKILVQSSNVIVSNFGSVFNKNFKKQNFLQFIDQDLEWELSALIFKLNDFTNVDSIYNIIINNDNLMDNIWSNNDNFMTLNQQQILILWTVSSFLPDISNDVNKQDIIEDINANSIDDFLNLDNENNNDDKLYKYNNIASICLEYINSIMENTLSINNISRENIMTTEQETLICTMLWSLHKIITVMDEQFDDELIDYLYFIVENLASSSMKIRELAQLCINKLANVLYDGSINELIVNNVDYLVESISQRLNLGVTDKVTTVLMVICKMTGYEIVLSFQDVLETIFKMLDFYHGYKDMVLQFFNFFEIIINEMNKLYLKGDENIVKLSDSHLNSTSFKPWGNQTIEQLSAMLDDEFKHDNYNDSDNANVDTISENEPKNFQEYFDQKLKIHEAKNQKVEEIDSDDEEDIETEEEDKKDVNDEVEWVSPIPVLSYRLLIKILNYGDRLLTTSSKPIRIQILKNVSLIIPMLSTQYDSLLPQVAQIWESIVQCMFDKDYSVVIFAANALQMMIKYSNTFICKRFTEVWCELQENCHLLKEIHTLNGSYWRSNQLVKHINFPPITKNALVSLAEMLLEGIKLTESILDETVLTEMINCCLQVIPRELLSEKSLLIGDIVWDICN